MLVKLKTWWTNFNKSPEQKYLEKATDLVDLERRQKVITNKNLKGWV